MEITRKQILPVISAARELKAARAEHKKKIEYVSKIQARVLGEIPLYTDRLLDRKDCRKDNLRHITDVEEMYLSKDEEACKRVYDALVSIKALIAKASQAAVLAIMCESISIKI